MKHMDDRFDDQLRDAARDYNAPPETPREQMWDRIVATRKERTERTERAEKAEKAEKATRIIPLRPFRRLRPFRLPIGIAALLALGVGLGRLTAPAPTIPTHPPVAAVPAPQVSDMAYRLAAT